MQISLLLLALLISLGEAIIPAILPMFPGG
jgi:hypothetical protein